MVARVSIVETWPMIQGFGTAVTICVTAEIGRYLMEPDVVPEHLGSGGVGLLTRKQDGPP